MLKVAKFGGSSVSSAQQFRKVKQIIESDPARRVIVVSAAGQRNKQDHKLTDLLYLCHAHLTYGVPCTDIFSSIKERFIEIRNSLKLDYDIEAELEGLERQLNRDISVDYLVSRGEFLTSKLMAAYLGFEFLDAKDCIFMDYDGSFDLDKISKALKKKLKDDTRLVIPGFYGCVPSGKLKLMSRGGSDITGALAAAGLDSGVYENWTDVSGILMADPRIVDSPRPIPCLTYAELRELSFMGASVLHEDSILPVREKGIPLNIRNTNQPENPGTMVVESVEAEVSGQERFITGIAGRRNFDIITVSRHNMNTNKGLGGALDILQRHNVQAEHITLGIDSFAVVVSAAAAGDGLYDMISEIQKTLDADSVEVQDSIALVAAVGRKMTFRPGISGKLFNALGAEGVNIRTIAQGADELSIIIGVDNSQYETAVRVLYEGFTG